jgi:hypothetical protein
METKGGIKMKPHERRAMIEDMNLPTELVRRQVLDIFQDLAIAKKDISYFLLAEIQFVIEKVWEGDDLPIIEDIEFFLDQAVATSPEQYKKHARMGYRYLYRRDH